MNDFTALPIVLRDDSNQVRTTVEVSNLGQLCVFHIQFISVHCDLEKSFNESMKTNFVKNEMQYICLKKVINY